MLHSIFQFVNAKYVNIQMMCSLIEVSVKYVSEVLFTLFIRMSKCTWVDCLCIRDSVKCKLVRKLSNRVKRSKKSALLCTVRRVSSW